ncbi:MAG TPA: beta-galactosidase GalB [Chitinophagaceae bacterium]
MKRHSLLPVIALLSVVVSHAQLKYRSVVNFDKNWKFYYADTTDTKDDYKNSGFHDASWRTLNLPHDWSVEGSFSEKNPARPEGGALPGGIGWYRKTFSIPATSKGKSVFIDFDGVYRYSEVWINDHYLGKRPNGYISFRYELTPWLKYGDQKNVISVKVDNTHQPNSRWYSGSGIYRNVWLVTSSPVAVAHWGTYITTPKILPQLAAVEVKTSLIKGKAKTVTVSLRTLLTDAGGTEVARTTSKPIVLKDSLTEITQGLSIERPALWSIIHPYLYKATVQVLRDGVPVDDYVLSFGVRSFEFDANRGFILNGQPVKILGVCDHHDLGCLGSAINTRALERQLEILKGMGCNAIRTSHNPPAPELLDLCDRMGFIVMDEAFDMWKRSKTKYDYSLNWDEWHRIDLQYQVRRDRNHPSVFIWSIGNEIREQGDSNGTRIARELAAIVKSLDTTRPITDANNNPSTRNYIINSGAVDLIGFNYHHTAWQHFHDSFPGKKFIGTETTSALETRGEYDMPSDSIRRWPSRHMENGVRVTGKMNADYTVSAYDNVSAPWGSTHEESWKEMKKYPFLSGMFIWTGFDYLGEPTPYSWPARSSYFGIIDLAGFPKDVYYMYKSEWTNQTVLHLLPHWNWNAGDSIDVWAYYNNADEVELFLNGKSLGVKKKEGEDLHVQWRVSFEPGTLKAISRKNGQEVLTTTVTTAGKPAKIELSADRTTIDADGRDLSFVTVRILDAAGNLVPKADNLVQFKLNGEVFIAGVDNGNPISHEPFKASYRKAFNGLALAVIQAKEKKGKVTLTAESNGLQSTSIDIELK